VFLAYNEEHIVDKTRLYPGVEETLSALRSAGKTLAVVSNKNVALCRKVLTTLKADGCFACIIGADSLKERKPAPEPLFKVMRDLGVSPQRAAIVGDSINDIAAGKSAGIVTVGCTFGYGNRTEVEGADYLIDTVPGLLELPIFVGK
jgi:phosphoglycolate phosphatase